MKSFARGIHIPEHKEATEKLQTTELPAPKRVVLPLQQNLGCPNAPLVKVGDQVYAGQKVGDAQKFVSAPIHAPIAGKVTQIERMYNACGFDAPSIVIEATENPIKGPGEECQRLLEDLTPEQIRKIVRETGIVGLGGAAFPTHVKLTPPKEKPIDTIIINGCECEPFITIDHRLMLEKTDDLIFGTQAVAKAVGAKNIIFGIENNKPDAIKKIQNSIRDSHMAVIPVKTKYPQGGEKMLIKAILGRAVPSKGLPMDVGVVVQNIGTAIAISQAVKFDIPLVKRGLTVTGSGIKNPQNIIAHIGTTFQEVIDHCGGLTDDTVKVIMGGPMTGIAVSSLDTPVVKATSCILALNKKDARNYEEKNCIRCGKCIKACPVGLTPNFLGDFAKMKDWERMQEYNVADCIECGCCSYVCPSKIYLVQYFKVAKRELQTRKAVCK